MIIVILTLAIFVFSGSMIFMRRGLRRQLVNGLSLLVIVASIGLIIANDNHHFGMEKVSHTQTYTLQSSVATPGIQLLLYHKLGTGNERIYLYRTTHSTKLLKTATHNSQVIVKQNTRRAQLQLRTTRWVYQNKLMTALFGITNENHQLANRHYQFNLPATWYVISTNAAQNK